MDTIDIAGKEYSELDILAEREDYIRLEAVDLCFALLALAKDDSPVVRAAVARKKIAHELLVSDVNWRVRATVAEYADKSAVLDVLLNDKNDFVRFVLVKRGHGLNHLVNDVDEEISSIAHYQLQSKKQSRVVKMDMVHL